MTSELDFVNGWRVLQDVHDFGEEQIIYHSGWESRDVAAGFSEWQPIEDLKHLQLQFSKTPYFGRELRYFNEHPWWYRFEFNVSPERKNDYARLHFEGVDYFSKVWLNGEFLGEHEGYSSPFEFEVGHLLDTDEPNVLVVKVWSPWDKEVIPEKKDHRVFAVVRDMVKGTYEHADTFIQRDVNPVGLWGKVKLVFHSGVYFSEKPQIGTRLSEDLKTAKVKVACPVRNNAKSLEITLCCRIQDQDTGATVAVVERKEVLPVGETPLDIPVTIQSPKLWWTWDQGDPGMYRAVIELSSEEGVLQTTEERFGVRSIELSRTEEETLFLLNGKKIFLRGTTYFPDVYVSNIHQSRYQRDLAAIKRAGCNAVRIHVHVERPEFYDLCDELGIAVIQDSDLNWVHPTDEVWKDRAVKVFGDMIRNLRNHPSIISWVCYNEPISEEGNPTDYSKGYALNTCPGPQLVAEAKRLDPQRPAIRGSGAWDDLESGDSHNYKGSLTGEETHYTDIYGHPEKLNTEFGFDAPACAENLRLVPDVFTRLMPIIKEIKDLQYYQYRLLKYYIEQYRITKFRPCSGYFQFMFIDLCPQSFYGVYDWWGGPKEGLKAFEESNQPLGVFMEYQFDPVAIWVVNDLPRDFPGCSVQWIVQGQGREVTNGQLELDIPKNLSIRVSDLSFPVEDDIDYQVCLFLHDSRGDVLAKNIYRNPFRHPLHPKGHPAYMSHEIGMRLYGA